MNRFLSLIQVYFSIVDIIKIGEKLNYTLKGDVNNTEDSEKVTFSNIEGIYIKKLNLIGKLINFMQKPYGMVIIFMTPILLILYVINNEKVKEENRKQMQILEQLDKVKQPYRNILDKFYIQGKSLVVIAAEMGYNYEHIKKMNGIALNIFDNIK